MARLRRVFDDVPDRATLVWAAARIGPTATAHLAERLSGGAHASTHLLHTAGPDDEVVLRRYPPGDDAAAREVQVLTALDGLGGLAPRLLGADPDGAETGLPTVLLSRLPGRAELLTDDPYRCAGQLAQALARIHATPAEQLTGFRDILTGTARRPAERTGAAAALVSAGIDRLHGAPRVLTHLDFWTGNALWRDDTLTGVVDWSGAGLAPRGHDLAWCRLDLVLLHDHDVADAFLDAYRAAAGVPVADMLLWDLRALVCSDSTVQTWVDNYADLGRRDLTPAELRKRHGGWLRARLAAG